VRTVLLITTIAILIISLIAFEAKVSFDHNANNVANRAFKFKNVSSPVKDDVGAKAKLTLVDGELDPAGADLAALTDGRLPTGEDQPGANVFFNAGTSGGSFLMDLGSISAIAQVNSYSWHPNTRGPQLYKLYASDGAEARFNAAPKRGIDPISCGWKFIATVSTIPNAGEEGGQYGVSITDPSGSLGKYRYLLFDCYATEMNDDWGNTFYSEIDVIGK
jgi:hypothetical protein